MIPTKLKETKLPYNSTKINNLATFVVQAELFQHTFNYEYKALTVGQQVLHNISILSGDMDNGGLVQYYQNNKDTYFKGTLDALRLIEDKKTFILFQKTIELYKRNEAFFSGKNLDAELSEKDESKFSEMDNTYYEYADEREMLLTKYLQKNIADFFLPA